MKPLRKKLVEKLKNRLGEKELELLENAIDFAEKSHNGQKRKSGEPFIKHPLRVAYSLTKYKLDLNTIVSAVLHDTVEDCSVPLEEIKIKFGPEVAFLVQSLTKISAFKYKEPQKDIFLEKESFRNMILAMAKDLRVILIKLADRLDNAKTFWALEENKKNQKAKETLEIYAPLAYRLGMTDIGAKLEDLSFPYVFKEEYKETKKIVGNHREELENYLKELVPVLEKKLKENKLFLFKIKFRAKHLYSIWRKLQKEEMDIKRVYDLVALRIILKKTEDCYLALGIIHGLWKPVPGRFKDYIALPKPNGYRSLHTSVFAEKGRIVEIQIRTKEMDEEAEKGIASHWLYKSSKDIKNPKKIQIKDFLWINQLQQWQKEFSRSKNFLEFLKTDFFKDRIFVLTPKGDVIDLPDGATPIDFAYQVHTEIGNQALGAKVNGKLVPFDYKLKSGELVEIILKKGKLPSSGWLEFVKMAETKKKIQEALKKKSF